MNKPLALLTGVGRLVGIAAGIARQLATDGWDSVLNYWAPYDGRMPWSDHTGNRHTLHSKLARLCHSRAQLLFRRNCRFSDPSPFGSSSDCIVGSVSYRSRHAILNLAMLIFTKAQ